MEPVTGDKIWRPVVDGEIINIDFGEPNDRGQTIMRTQRWGDKWVIVDNNSAGIVCFCRNAIPDDWTFMLVVAVSKNKKTLFVEPRSGDSKDLLDAHA